MRVLVVAETAPVADGAVCVLDSIETLALDALVLQRPLHTLDHTFC
ncbi:hypothetical protein OEZ60_11505 [Defluviimonas sp. WL0024]|uniref:Uncharacterized protein n=1 Tax=Albidovulum salinarum TaxID=2984153 RepID=A0ABT2X6K4_9RHOB|nr:MULTISPECIES: hypothetical protein [Defluviimonas]MCU9848632.1 hypothetical protein [Defluviimonas sp. WL0024]